MLKNNTPPLMKSTTIGTIKHISQQSKYDINIKNILPRGNRQVTNVTN